MPEEYNPDKVSMGPASVIKTACEWYNVLSQLIGRTLTLGAG